MADSQDQAPRVRLVEGQEVSLGCGTLIIIALIVMFLAGGKNDDLKEEVQGLRGEVAQLRTAIESLEATIENRD